MLRITSSKIIPSAVGAISSRGTLSGWIINAINGCDQNALAICHHQYFSTDVKKQIDRKIVNTIKSEIKLREMPLDTGMPAIPNNFPFTIKDNPWESHITLSRNFDGEKIEVIVDKDIFMNNQEKFDNEDYHCDLDTWLANSRRWLSTLSNDNNNSYNEASMDLMATITKENGKIMQFKIYAQLDGKMYSSRMYLNEPGLHKEPESGCMSVPEFSSRKMRHDWQEFLKVRGIWSDYGFLYEYMYIKYKKYPLIALKKLSNFIAD